MASSTSYIVAILALASLCSVAYAASAASCGAAQLSGYDPIKYPNCDVLMVGNTGVAAKDQCNCTSYYKTLEKCYKDLGLPTNKVYDPVYTACGTKSGASSLSASAVSSGVLTLLAAAVYRALV